MLSTRQPVVSTFFSFIDTLLTYVDVIDISATCVDKIHDGRHRSLILKNWYNVLRNLKKLIKLSAKCSKNRVLLRRQAACVDIFAFYRHMFRMCRWRRHNKKVTNLVTFYISPAKACCKRDFFSSSRQAILRW